MSRKVTIYSPAGKNAKQLEVSGGTWKELQRVLSTNNVSYSGMKAVIGENRLTMESDNAVLPDGDFTLFLMPIKTKSGADRKELMATIKDFVTANPHRKQDFIIDGKNMTQLSTPTLEGLVARHIAGKSAEKAPETVSDKHIAESAKKAAETVKKAKEEAGEEVDYPALIAAKKAEVDAALKAGNYAALGGLGAEVTKLEEEAKQYAEKKAKEKAEAERLEKEAAEKSSKQSGERLVQDLDKQARDIARDFKDLKSF